MTKIHHFSSFWKRQEKYDRLTNTEFADVPWKELELKEPYYFFVPKDFEAKEKYDEGFSVSEIFDVNSSWITTSRDDFVIDENKNNLENKIKDFISLSKEDLFKKYNLRDNISTSIDIAKSKIIFDEELFSKITYKIFDERYIFYSDLLLHRSRRKCMSNMLEKNLWLVLMRQFVEDNWFNHVFASKNMVDNRTFSSSRWTAYFFPLYLYQQNPLEWTEEKIPNFNSEVIEKIEKKLWLHLSPDSMESGLGEKTFTPENLFDYIYAVLHSKTYRETYKEFLKIDFPKVPFDIDKETFFKMRDLWRELRSYHLMENENLIPKNFITKYEIDGGNKVEKVKLVEMFRWNICTENIQNTENESEKFWNLFINDTQYFANVPKEVFEFYIWWYQPAQKWLKDRKGRELNYEDIIHYSKIILSLKETIRIMEEVEGVFKV